jgi:hypothetical protein
MRCAFLFVVLVGCVGCTSGGGASPTTGPIIGSSTVAPTTDGDAGTATSVTSVDDAERSAAPSSTTTAATAEPCSTSPLAVAKAFVEAVQANDQAAYLRCESDTNPPAIDRIGNLRSFGTLLMDKATTTSQAGDAPGSVEVDVPSPRKPRPEQPDQIAGVIISLTGTDAGGYFVTDVVVYAST